MRVRRPFFHINKYKGYDAGVIEMRHLEEEREFKQIVSQADVIIAKPGAQKFMEQVKILFPQKPVIFDMDDDVFNMHPSSEHYRNYGTEDVNVNGIDLWKTGKDGFNKWANRQTLLSLQWAIEEADAVFAVTDRLAEYISYRAGGRDVYTIPNATDFTLYPDVEVNDPAKQGEFRIGFCGGMSHFGDINMIKDELIKFLKADKKRVFYMIGQEFKGFEDVRDQVRHEPWVPFEGSGYRMKLLDLDVLIAPLQELPFNIKKDPLKFWDASALRVPLLASNIPPFSDVMKDGENGLLFDTPEEMTKKLKKLEKKRSWGKELANNAYDWVYANRNLEKLVPYIIETYKQVREDKRNRLKSQSSVVNKEVSP